MNVRNKKLIHILIRFLIGLIVVCILLFLCLIIYLKIYKDPWINKISLSGFVEKSVLINQVNFSYQEGPGNGEPLVLLHAQHMDWYSYSRVLPELSKRYHIFDISYPGHGKTICPENYPMNVTRIGNDVSDFIKEVIGQSVYITGNSSGGLLSTWLGANKKDMVKAIILEDPPLFSAEYPRIKKTIAYRSFETSYNFVYENQQDFLLYWVHSNSVFFDNNVFKGSSLILSNIIRLYRFLNNNEPIDIGLLPNDAVRCFIRGLDQYNARFGAAFYDGTWNTNFDHAEALKMITCPVLLLHAQYTIMNDGTLNGAMSDEDAKRAVSLLKNVKYKKIDASHVVHLDKPHEFIRIVKDFFK